MPTADTLRSALEEIAADPTSRKSRTWKRPANPIIMDEYRAFVASGRYPYNDSVVTEIVKKYELSDDLEQRFGHQAVHDRGDALLIALHTEVYIASGQHKVEEMERQEREFAEAGFVPITELEPVAGMKVKLTDGATYRLAKARDDWALLPPRKRSHGISLNGLVQQHRAFMEAVECRQTSMNNPAVRMFKAAS